MRILILYRDGVNNGSTRVRALQFVDSWRNNGVLVTLMKRKSGKNFFSLFKFYVILILKSRQSDILFIQKPNLPVFLYLLLCKIGVKMVVDIDDAVWESSLTPSTKESRRRADRIGHHFFYSVKYSDLVVCGSFYLESIIRQKVGLVNSLVIPPSVVQKEIPPFDIINWKKPVVGWIGSESNLKDLNLVYSPLFNLVKNGFIEFVIICSTLPKDFSPWAKLIPWSIETEAESLSSLNIGIVPLEDSPRSRGRCGYKTIQYMNYGLPVIASSVGANLEIIENYFDGILLESFDSWEESLLKLISSPDLCCYLGSNAKRKVYNRFNLNYNSELLLDSFFSLK